MKKKIYIVDAFTSELYAGNPAGIVLEADDLNDVQMQKIASELNLSETAFVLKPEGKSENSNANYDFEVRFFTPTSEVELCGHATIATFYLLNKLGKLSNDKTQFMQKTKAGLLDIRFDDGNVIMKQAKPQNINKELSVDKLADVMNVDVSDIGIEGVISGYKLMPEIWSTGLEDILMPVKSLSILKNMQPDMKALAEYSNHLDVVGVHAFCFDNGQIICRNFAPAFGIPEESATGTSNGALGGYLADKGYSGGEFEFTVCQGDFMGRPSRIFVKINNNPVEVWVGGKACVVMDGIINI